MNLLHESCMRFAVVSCLTADSLATGSVVAVPSVHERMGANLQKWKTKLQICKKTRSEFHIFERGKNTAPSHFISFLPIYFLTIYFLAIQNLSSYRAALCFPLANLLHY